MHLHSEKNPLEDPRERKRRQEEERRRKNGEITRGLRRGLPRKPGAWGETR